jgi:type I restriction enzyme R subunit
LAEEVGRDYDLFDLVCHVAFDQPPLTRKERAENVRKRNYFTKYGDNARQVLDTLLDKYADSGITNIENSQVLELRPINQLGTKVQIIRDVFGGKDKYWNAIRELEQELYRA